MTYPSGSWYMKVDDGGFAEAGPLTGGSMTVAVDSTDTYTFTFDFVDKDQRRSRSLPVQPKVP